MKTVYEKENQTEIAQFLVQWEIGIIGSLSRNVYRSPEASGIFPNPIEYL
jgi:hypothetical protein